jgi:hypothetical protein
MSQIEDADRHEIYLSRLTTQLLNSHVYPSLEAAYKAARALLLDAESIDSIIVMKKLQREIGKAAAEELRKGWDDTTEGLEEMAAYEAGYAAKLTGAEVGAALVVPAADKVKYYIDKSVMTLTSGSRVSSGAWAEFVNGSIDSAVRQYNGIIASGYQSGQTVNQMAKSIRDSTQGLLKGQAEVLARTGQSHYANQAREAMAIDNRSVIKYRVFIATFDNRTTINCRSQSGRSWPITADDYPRLPLHFGCLLGDTKITSSSAITGASKRPFKGEIFTIVSRSGRKISVTPNHPILTSRGWVAAKELNLTDSLFCEPVSHATRWFSGYDNGIESTVEDIFESLGASGKVLTREVELSAPDFHGDCADNEIGVIRTDVLLEEKIDSVFRQNGSELIFNMGGFDSKSIKSCFSRLALRFKIWARYAKAVVSESFSKHVNWSYCHSGFLLGGIASYFNAKFDKLFLGKDRAKVKLFAGSAKPNAVVIELEKIRQQGLESSFGGHSLLLGAIPDFDPCTSKDFSDHGEIAVKLFTEMANSGTGDVFIDDIISINRSFYDGHVFNLQTLSETYSANGIVAHNCRSIYVYTNDPAKLKQGTKAAVGGKAGVEIDPERKLQYRGRKDSDIFKPGQIDAGESMDAWMRRQPDWFVEDSLGETRAKLFKEGGLSIDKFADLTGKPLTLSELRDRDAAAFKRAGL